MNDGKNIKNIVDKYNEPGKKKKKSKIKIFWIVLLILVIIIAGLFIGGKMIIDNFLNEITQTEKEPGEPDAEKKPAGKMIEAKEAESIAKEEIMNLIGLDISGFEGDIKYIDVVNNQGYYEMNFYQGDLHVGTRVRSDDKKVIFLSQEKATTAKSKIGIEKAQGVAEEFLKKHEPIKFDKLTMSDKVTGKNSADETVNYKFKFNEKIDGKEDKSYCIYIYVNAFEEYVEYYKEIVF